MFNNSEEREKILAKIRALANMANPENGAFEQEIETASKAMQRLMDQYNVSLVEVMTEQSNSDVNFEFVKEKSTVLLGIMKKWHWGLAKAISQITGTRYYSTAGIGKTARDPNGKDKHGRRMSFFGTSQATQLAVELFDMWVIDIDAMAVKETSEYIKNLKEKYAVEMEIEDIKDVRHMYLGNEHPNVWRNSWLEGVVAGINYALREAEQERTDETSTAIAVISEALDVAYQKMSINFSHVRSSANNGNYSAYSKGSEVGKKIRLTSKKIE
jgi:hypothetical protein